LTGKKEECKTEEECLEDKKIADDHMFNNTDHSILFFYDVNELNRIKEFLKEFNNNPNFKDYFKEMGHHEQLVHFFHILFFNTFKPNYTDDGYSINEVRDSYRRVI
jgi:hypothetical protein